MDLDGVELIKEERKMYKYAFIDAQLILVRTIKALQGSAPDGICQRSDVLRTFLYSIFKIVREVGVERPFLLWDSSPYWKSSILNKMLGESQYKADRWYATDDDVANMKVRIEDLTSILAELMVNDPESSRIGELGKELENLRNTVKQAELQIANFHVRQDVKYHIINELGRFGMTSIIKRGWESDDIAYLLCKQVEHDIKPSLVVSTDTDWEYWINPNCVKYNNYSRKFTTYEEVRSRHKQIVDLHPDWDLFKIKSYVDTLYGSHNNLSKTLNPEWNKRSIDEILENPDEAFSDRKLFEAQMATWDFGNYPDFQFISSCLPWYSKKGTLDTFKEFCKYVNEQKLGMNPRKYLDLINSANYELYVSIEEYNEMIAEELRKKLEEAQSNGE